MIKNDRRKIGFGLVGTGAVAPFHIRAINKNKEARLVGVFSGSVSRGRYFANKLRIKHYMKYSDMLKDDVIDVIDIITYNYLHADYAIEAIEYGKHVLVEKPIDIDLAKAQRLIKLAEEKHRKLSCVSEFRFSPGITELRDLIKKDALGRVFLIDISLFLHRDDKYFLNSGGWRSKTELAGGGVLIMNAIHVIDILLWLFGPIKKIYVRKMNVRNYIEVEECAGLLMELENNILCLISATSAAAQEAPITIEVHGINGSVRLEDFTIIRNPGQNKVIRSFCLIDKIKKFINKKSLFDICFYHQIKDIIDAIKEGREPVTNGTFGVDALKVIKKIYECCNSD
ncbi:MAG: Gfo/Idh/MocA family oxidoreductase [Candidatus Omnitrophota bacterium]